MVAIKQQLVKRTNRISSGKNLVNYITIHETANTVPGANAQSHANLQSNGNPRQASWHYQIDDKQIIQSYPDKARCWHAGGNGNYQSIGIEICVNADGDFAKAIENAVKLVKILMARYNLNDTRVVQHNFWTGKDCPRFLRNGSKGINWTQFKANLNGTGSTASNYLVLKYGDVGDRVKLYQDKLKRAGYQIDVDGSFGPAMLSVVKQFQADNNLTIDGYLGPDTQKTLNAILIAQRKNPQPKEEPKLYKPSAKAILNPTAKVLRRLENKSEDPLDPKWRKQLLAGDLTESDAIGLIYVAIDRGQIVGK